MAAKQRRPTGREAATGNLRDIATELDQSDRRIPTRDELVFVLNIVRGYLPSPRMMVFYGALGALAVLEMVEWPVAAAIVAGAAVARRSSSAPSAELAGS
ncbi:hypothetical protein A8924_4848 [Saccharopolyspora erythraea NRRL 2338]|nr:hypothetical protein [Saccharopolyspora erythraea]EQD86203.1 hypothetical protein N599_10870 [Saccharopolyspora erythraea D]PFG97411.1 hypothetical protein A8924_4848 [Saccharopolyspora erythraea NRRL 2338]QRK87590.1 hypothetical protein JQX30_22715 [Saccharopolyspora erythraea]